MNTTTKRPHYLNEFPSFDGSAIVEGLLAQGWTDNSWHNDTCPCLVHPNGDLQMWVEWADPEQRESGGSRFCVQKVDHEGEGWQESDDIACGEELEPVLAAARAWVESQQ